MSISEKPLWAPLGLDSWSDDNYGSSLRRIGSQLDGLVDLDRPHCYKFANIALRGSLAKQAERNNAINSLTVTDSILFDQARRGLLTPSGSVVLLQSQPAIDSMEIARLTHAGDWSTNEIVDVPVRKDLENADIDTQKLQTDSYYKINALHQYQSPEAVAVKRKREVMSHFGGSIITVVVNTLLIDLKDKQPETRKLRKAIHDNLAQVKDQVDIDKRQGYLRTELEAHLRTREADEIPGAIIPLSTLYYVTRASERS